MCLHVCARVCGWLRLVWCVGVCVFVCGCLCVGVRVRLIVRVCVRLVVYVVASVIGCLIVGLCGCVYVCGWLCACLCVVMCSCVCTAWLCLFVCASVPAPSKGEGNWCDAAIKKRGAISVPKRGSFFVLQWCRTPLRMHACIYVLISANTQTTESHMIQLLKIKTFS